MRRRYPFLGIEADVCPFYAGLYASGKILCGEIIWPEDIGIFYAVFSADADIQRTGGECENVCSSIVLSDTDRLVGLWYFQRGDAQEVDRILYREHLHGILSYVCVDPDLFILYAFSGGDSDLPEEGTGEGIFHLRIYGCDRVLPLACSDMQTIYPADALWRWFRIRTCNAEFRDGLL